MILSNTVFKIVGNVVVGCCCLVLLVVDKAARGGETVLKHLENKGNTWFHTYFACFL